MCSVLAAGIVAVILNLLLPEETPEGSRLEEGDGDAGDVEEVHHGADDDAGKLEKV
jgi:hypothetical protein